MSTSADVARALRERLSLDVAGVELAAGGDINDAYRAEIADGTSIFVKTSDSAAPGMFTDEAAGLAWLGEPASGLRTPEVIGVVDDPPEPDATHPRLLALRWVDRAPLDATGEERLGRGLAKIHAAGAPAFGATPVLNLDGSLNPVRHGRSPMRFNELSLPNDPCPTWAEFYAERRIRPLVRACRDRGELSAEDSELFQRLCARLPHLAGPAEPPARIHGDLWSGNVMASADGEVYLIDPVAHGGHRELDLALLTVFGGPSERCFDAYAEVSPPADGHAGRVQLWQLGMILLHVYLFGGAYRGQALAIAKSYL